MWSPSATVVEALARRAGDSARGFTFISEGAEDDEFVSYAALAGAVSKRAGSLKSLGLRTGDHVAIALPNRREFVFTFLGALWAGIVPVPVAPPMGLDKISSYLDRTRHIIDHSDAKALITSPQVKAVSGSLISGTLSAVLSTDELERAGADPIPPFSASPEDVAFVQFTSGSTTRPRGVVLTHRNLSVNCHALAAKGLKLTPEDKLCSWLPFFHDFGLIGMILSPIFTGSSAIYLPPLLFLKRPAEWLRAVSRYRATISFAPNFGYALCTKRVADADIEALDLSSWRYAGCGAEPVRMETLEAFARRFEPAG